MILVLAALFFSVVAEASLTNVDFQYAGFGATNLIRNGGMEEGLSGWASSGGTFSRTCTSGTTARTTSSEGRCFGTWDSSSAGQTLTSTFAYGVATAPTAWRETEVYGQCLVKCATGTCTHKIQMWNGSSLMAENTIRSSTTKWEIASTPIVYNSTANPVIRFTSVAADEPTLQYDRCFVVRADQYNLSTGPVITAWQSYTPTFTGFGTATSIAFQWRIVGDTVEVVGNFLMGTTTGVEARVSLPNGYTVSSSVNSNTVSGLYWDDATPYHVISAPNNSYVTFANSTPGASITNLLGTQIGSSGEIISMKFSERVNGLSAIATSIRADQLIQSWTGYHDATCTWARTNTVYGDPAADASCALVDRLKTNLSVTPALSGSDALPGIVFNSAIARKFRVCATPKLYTDASTQFLDARLTDGTTVIAEWHFRGATTNQATSFERCGSYQAVVGTNTLKIQLASSAGTTSINPTGTALPLAAIEWSVFAEDTPQAAPLLVGSVTSNSAGLERVERARVTCGSSGSAVATQSGSWISSMTNGGGAGTCTVNIAASIFSGEPACSCTTLGTGSASASHCMFTANPTSSALVILRARAGANENGDITLNCQGPR